MLPTPSFTPFSLSLFVIHITRLQGFKTGRAFTGRVGTREPYLIESLESVGPAGLEDELSVARNVMDTGL